MHKNCPVDESCGYLGWTEKNNVNLHGDVSSAKGNEEQRTLTRKLWSLGEFFMILRR